MTTTISGTSIVGDLVNCTNVQVDGLSIQDVPSNAQTVAYTLALSDRGKCIDTTAQVTIPTNAAVAFPIGTVITITNTSAAAISIVDTGITLRFAGTTNTGNRTLSAYGVATIRKQGTDTWYITGVSLS
jgi:hypothetical protein